ncbi:MAG: MerR family transcriptional regulator [Verrucomicrobiales bacterium]|nr:MerR family transcriptional regulator [Verrucomicrobiales bacterium]
MHPNRSLSELADAVNAWCREHQVTPANGQAAERLTDRNIRFYRTIGLLDAPESGGGRGYGEKHFLQLTAIRLLQARALPLRQIRELLHGRNLSELRRVEAQGLQELRQLSARPAALPPALPPMGETWAVVALDSEFLLLSRTGQTIPAGLREHLQSALHSWQQQRNAEP